MTRAREGLATFFSFVRQTFVAAFRVLAALLTLN
jgi:hypothetical protein